MKLGEITSSIRKFIGRCMEEIKCLHLRVIKIVTEAVISLKKSFFQTYYMPFILNTASCTTKLRWHAVQIVLGGNEDGSIRIEFFTVNTKLPEMAILENPSEDFIAVKKLPPVGLDLMITGSRDYHWFKSLMLNQLS